VKATRTRRPFAGGVVLLAVATTIAACDVAPVVPSLSDGGVEHDATFEGVATDVAPETQPPVDAGVPGPCTGATMLGSLAFVSGTIRGSRLDAVVRDRTMRAALLGPAEAPLSGYQQSFDAFASPDGRLHDPFVVNDPPEVISNSLRGYAGLAAAAVGTYSPSSNGCGYFVFEEQLPSPPGVACSRQLAPCDPQCMPSGEVGICVPREPIVRYRAVAAPCVQANGPAAGDWQLTLTSVCPNALADTGIMFESHGHLTATLVNDDDATDTVVMNLDF